MPHVLLEQLLSKVAGVRPRRAGRGPRTVATDARDHPARRRMRRAPRPPAAPVADRVRNRSLIGESVDVDQEQGGRTLLSQPASSRSKARRFTWVSGRDAHQSSSRWRARAPHPLLTCSARPRPGPPPLRGSGATSATSNNAKSGGAAASWRQRDGRLRALRRRTGRRRSPPTDHPAQTGREPGSRPRHRHQEEQRGGRQIAGRKGSWPRMPGGLPRRRPRRGRSESNRPLADPRPSRPCSASARSLGFASGAQRRPRRPPRSVFRRKGPGTPSRWARKPRNRPPPWRSVFAETMSSCQVLHSACQTRDQAGQNRSFTSSITRSTPGGADCRQVSPNPHHPNEVGVRVVEQPPPAEEGCAHRANLRGDPARGVGRSPHHPRRWAPTRRWRHLTSLPRNQEVVGMRRTPTALPSRHHSGARRERRRPPFGSSFEGGRLCDWSDGDGVCFSRPRWRPDWWVISRSRAALDAARFQEAWWSAAELLPAVPRLRRDGPRSLSHIQPREPEYHLHSDSRRRCLPYPVTLARAMPAISMSSGDRR
jgi:hypothetical protein